MGYEENRAGKPASLALFLALLRPLAKWMLRLKTQRILSQMSDQQLKDIGLTREDIRRYPHD